MPKGKVTATGSSVVDATTITNNEEDSMDTTTSTTPSGAIMKNGVVEGFNPTTIDEVVGVDIPLTYKCKMDKKSEGREYTVAVRFPSLTLLANAALASVTTEARRLTQAGEINGNGQPVLLRVTTEGVVVARTTEQEVEYLARLSADELKQKLAEAKAALALAEAALAMK